MAGAPHGHGPAVCVTLERRRSDFERDVRVTPFTGSCCCCCCCLHWIGAAVGGIVGMRLGWERGEKAMDAPLPPEAKLALRRGVWIGSGISAALVAVSVVLAATDAIGDYGAGYLYVLAFAPSVAFLPVAVPMVVGAYRLRGKMLAAFRKDVMKLPAKDGSDKSMSLYRAKLTAPPKTRDPLVQFSVFCRACWGDLGESMHLANCPECGVAIDRPVISGPDYGVRVAWRAALTSFGLSTGLTVLGYGAIVLLALLFK